MSCERIREHLTSYLDGEVSSDLGSVIRGHLRGCDHCRGLANDEAALRDGLRAMPSVDAPASLWAGVQARLAQEEVADSRRPAWRRALARWTPMFTPMRFATGGLVMAAAITLVWWKTKPVADEPVSIADRINPSDHAVQLQQPDPPTTAADDVTKDLTKDAERETLGYRTAAEELLKTAETASTRWTDDQKTMFAVKVAKIRAGIDAAPEGRQRQKAWRELSRYLQGAVIRDVIASRDTALTGGVQ